ncbi:MAG: AEC family transporter [Clostridium luticellarii]|jgi:predicted permease|uniref:AEC family transporter n=1 Tax=Clostridium luticellarii TaxID=1691940 RepID=UPI002355A6AE|nr:AEC family transporter [Clostridium luticellarii]MCI2039836.1 AEC family transporter [Clostridium luticellarii]
MVQTVLSTLIQVIVPLSIPVIAGVLLVRFKNLETKHLVTLVLYYLTPGMIFQALITAQVSWGDVYKTLVFSIVNLIFMWAAANILGKILKLSSPNIAGLTLISTLTNSNNYGLPLVLLAFGKLGLGKASIYVVVQMIIVNTIGVYFAARSRFSAKDAIKSVFSLPAIYAALLAVLLRVLNLNLPGGIEEGINMISQAYSPIVLAILGAQMASVKNSNLELESQTTFWSGMICRLLLSPIITCLCLYILHISGMLYSVLFILASMPVAVNSVILAEKFDASPQIVSKCILWTTLASFIILPILIVLVK